MSRHGVRFDPAAIIARCGGIRAAARLTGLAPVTLRHPLTVASADKAATALGMHPAEIWPGFHDDLISDPRGPVEAEAWADWHRDWIEWCDAHPDDDPPLSDDEDPGPTEPYGE